MLHKGEQSGHVCRAADPRESLSCQIPGSVGVGAPHLTSFIIPVVAGIRAKDDQEGENRSGEGEVERRHGKL